MTNPSFDLGPDGETGASSLVAAVKLNRRGLHVEVVIPGHERRADANTALQELKRRAAAAASPGSGLTRLRDDWYISSRSSIADWVRNVASTGASPGNSAPVAWIDLRDVEDRKRREVIVRLNMQRDFLTTAGPVTLVVVLSDYADRQYCPDLMSIASVFSIFSSPPQPVRTMTGPVGFLHISDVHLRGAEAWDSDIVRKNFLRDLPGLLDASEVVPHLVFATGDFADRGAAEGFRRAHEFLLQVMDVCAARVPAEERVGPSGKVGVDVREWHAPRLFLVPGNHDVSRNAITRQNRALQSMLLGLRENHTAFRNELGEWWSDSTFADLSGPRLADYYAFTRLVLGDVRQTAPDRGFRVDVVPVRGLRVGVLGLNSAWMSGAGDAPNAMPVGERQVRAALDELEVAGGADVVFALVHHPPDWWPAAERKTIQALLRERAHVVLHGHVHDDEWVQTSSPGGELVTLTAGALYAGAGQRHGFQLGRLEPASSRLWVQALTYSDRGAGQWHPDGSPQGHENLPTGTFSFPLRRVVAAQPAGTVRATDGLVERLARLAANLYGAVDFVGFPSESGRPAIARVDTLVVPQRFSGPVGRAGDVRYETVRDGLLAAEAKVRFQYTAFYKGHTEVGEQERRIRISDFRQSSLFVVLGEPGAGKTLLTRSLAWHVASADVPKVPLLVPLRDWIAAGAKQKLLEFAAGSLSAMLSEAVSVETVQQLAMAGRAVLLVDGFDEVVESGQRIRVRDAVVAVAGEYPKLAILCTSRITGYRTAPLPDSFESLTLAPYDNADLDEFARRWFALQFPADPHARETRRLRFIAALNAEPRAKELARNPLLATLIAMVHLGEAELPSERAKLYELLVRLLVETWPKNACRVFREHPRFGVAQQRRVLEQVAFQMQTGRSGPDDVWVHTVFWAEADVVINRATLERATRDAIQDVLAVDELAAMALAQSWISFVAGGLGVLVERQPGQFGFLHLSLLEHLAGCHARRLWGRDGEQALAGQMIVAANGTHAWEMLLLMLGAEVTSRSVADAVVDGIGVAEFGVRAVRDDVDVSPETVGRMVLLALREVRGGAAEELSIERGLMLGSWLEQSVRFAKRNGEAVRSMLVELMSSGRGGDFAAAYFLAGESLRGLATARSDWKSMPSVCGLDVCAVYVSLQENLADRPTPTLDVLWAVSGLTSGAVWACEEGSAAMVVASAAALSSSSRAVSFRSASRHLCHRVGCRGISESVVAPVSRSMTTDIAYYVANGVSGADALSIPCAAAASVARTVAIYAGRTVRFELDLDWDPARDVAVDVVEDFISEIAKRASGRLPTGVAQEVSRQVAAEVVRQVAGDATVHCDVAPLLYAMPAISDALHGRLRAVDDQIGTPAQLEIYLRESLSEVLPSLARAVYAQTVFAATSLSGDGTYRLRVFHDELGKRLSALWAFWSYEAIASYVLKRESNTTAARAKIAAYALMARSILGEWPESKWLDEWRATPEPTNPEEWCERYIWRMCLAFDDPEDASLIAAARAVLAETGANDPDVDQRETAQWLQHVNLHPLTQAMMEEQSRASEEQWFKDVEQYGDAGWGDRVKRYYTREPDADAAASPATPPPAKAKRKSRRKQPDA